MSKEEIELIYWYINTKKYKSLLGLLCAQIVEINHYNDYKNNPAKYILKSFEKILVNK